VCVCVSATVMLNKISRKLRDLGLEFMSQKSLKESAYGGSIGDVIDDVTQFYDIILVMSLSSKSSHSETRTLDQLSTCGPFTQTLS